MDDVAMDTCHWHENRAMVERCEVCQRAVCGSCLWYAASGERLCPVHGEIWREQGKEVATSAPYQAEIGLSEVLQPPPEPPNVARYHANDTDLLALIGLLLSVFTAASCFGASYCIPCVGIVCAMIALLQVKTAYNSKRARTLAIVALGFNALIIIAGILLVVAFIVIVAANP